MRILVIGAGEVGRYIAERLIKEGHDLVVIDKNPGPIARINELDVFGVVGDGTDPATLRENGINHTDLVLAVSQIDSVNLTACAYASRLGAIRTVARLSESARTVEDERLAQAAFGVDWVINPDEAAAREIVGLLEGREVTDSMEFDEGRIRVIGVRVDEQSSLANKSLIELGKEYEGSAALVVAIVRDGATIIPRGNHRILPGDRVYLIGERADLGRLGAASEPSERPRGARVILVVGGGQVGDRVARRLGEAGFEVRLLEADRDRSEELAVTLERTTVFHGDGRNLVALKESGVESVDGFVSVSGDEETNVMSALLARHLGAPKVIALVKRTEYIPVLREIGLDAAVNPRLTAAGAILRFVRRGHILQVSTFRDIDAEVLELVASERSGVVGKPLHELSLPRDAILGGYSRGDEFRIPHGDTVLEPHDHVIVFALPSAIPKVEKMFAG